MNSTPILAKVGSARNSKGFKLSQIFRIDLNTLRTQRHAVIIVPFAFGLWSLLLGTDSNWDLRNYHLYNAFSFLNDKLNIDFAPAGFQSFFNPTLDVPYYLAITHLPPRLVGFLMGVVHGLNFVLLLVICRKVLSWLPDTDRHRTPLLLALAGCLTANFLSELGSTMGDNTTSLFCLASVLTVLHTAPRLTAQFTYSVLMLSAAGMLVGMGTGLKLTNAVYAVAICLGLLTLNFPPMMRIKIAFAFGVGVLVGIAATGGFWFYTIWQKFGNPLFPQFGNLFPNPLAGSVSVADTSWLPSGIWQQLAWPFIISADAQKVGQLAVRQVIWAIAYILLILLAIKCIVPKLRKEAMARMEPLTKFIIVVVVVGFFLWMKLFSIYRYLVPMDLLAPLVIYLLFNQLLPYSQAKRAASGAIGIATLVVLLGGIKTWGHEGWSDKPFRVDVPMLLDPAHTTVLMTEGDPPWAWLAVAFPSTVAFTQIEGNFPKGPNFLPKIRSMVDGRNGPTYALFQGHYDRHIERAASIREMADRFGLTSHPSRCAALQWVIEKFRIRATVVTGTNSSEGILCQLHLSSREPKQDIDSQNRAQREKAQSALKAYGYALDAQRCSLHHASIGDSKQVFQWCAVERAPHQKHD